MTLRTPGFFRLFRKPFRTTLGKDEGGAVAIEFAFIAPVMIILYMGLFQVSMLIMEDRRVSHSASVLGDLVTREATVDKDAVANIFQGAVEVLGMSNMTTLSGDVRMQLISLRMESDGSVNVIGSATVNDDTGEIWSPICATDIDSRLLNSKSGAVVARVNYKFKMQSHATAEDLENVDTTTYIDPEKDGVDLREQVVFKPRGPVDIPFRLDPAVPLNLSYGCDIENGVVECDDMLPVDNSLVGGC